MARTFTSPRFARASSISLEAVTQATRSSVSDLDVSVGDLEVIGVPVSYRR